eukprot:TRINITY_DN508_c0_g1_i1.p2 TRINITY_DN508_c0_g1~~TRINITY_DN508_c0_g1_i1.p2  ORF type:complete len:242 (-),score=41.87 TRINITY_DN508_c0_g1_i1:345-1010(-)
MARSKAMIMPACCLMAFAGFASHAFTGMNSGAPRNMARTARMAAEPDKFLDLSGVEGPVTDYVNIWVPMFKSAQEAGIAPEALIHWGHAGAMGMVLLAMGGFGSFLGWQIRLGNGATVYPLTLGKTAAEMHPLLMGAALFFFFLGGQGGLVLLATQGVPILQSAHSSTAVIGLGLMAIQAALGKTMGESPEKRTAHAFLGTGVMLVLLVHMVFGLNLGYSI